MVKPRLFSRLNLSAIVLVLGLAVLLAGLSLPVVQAATCGTGADGKPLQLGVGVDCGSSKNPIIGYTQGILKVIIPFVGVALVGVVVFGGLMIGTANGNSGRVQKGVGIIRNAIIALIAFIFMGALLQFLLPGV